MTKEIVSNLEMATVLRIRHSQTAPGDGRMGGKLRRGEFPQAAWFARIWDTTRRHFVSIVTHS
jgi:hypothetical protein